MSVQVCKIIHVFKTRVFNLKMIFFKNTHGSFQKRHFSENLSVDAFIFSHFHMVKKLLKDHFDIPLEFLMEGKGSYFVKIFSTGRTVSDYLRETFIKKS